MRELIKKIANANFFGIGEELFDPIYSAKHAKEHIFNSFEDLFKNFALPTVMIDEYGTLISYNPAFLQFYKLKKKDINFEQTVTKPMFERLIHLIQSMQEHKNSFAFRERFIKKREENGHKELDIFLSLTKLDEMHGNCYLLMMSPKSQDGYANETYSHEQRIKTLGELAGAISHDFNNILMAISGFTDLIMSRTAPKDVNYQDLEHIKQSIGKAASLVGRLLAFAKKQVLNVVRMSPINKFSELNDMLQRLIGAGIMLSIKITSDTHDIMVDPVQFEQIVLNLVLNASQAIPDPTFGAIKISVSNCMIDNSIACQKGYFNPLQDSIIKQGEYVKISIKDNGRGIETRVLHQIFDPFFSTKTEKNGTGLGLSTVLGIMQQSNGHILVKSKVMVGTEFVLLFPRAGAATKQIAPQASQPIAYNNNENEPGRKHKILVIEDEESIRICLEQMLRNNGYNVTSYANAKRAWVELERENNFAFDLIISDVIMPEVNGPEFLKRIRVKNPTIREIFISGFGEDVFNKEFGDSREFNFLSKPFAFQDLFDKIGQVMK